VRLAGRLLLEDGAERSFSNSSWNSIVGGGQANTAYVDQPGYVPMKVISLGVTEEYDR
jgi:hypothetical protein